MRDALAGVWLTSSDRMFERVSILDDAAMQLLESPLPEDQRRAAERAAHQLAGTCGTFGFSQATDLAREAERSLGGSEPIVSNAIFRLAEIAVALRDQLSAGFPALPLAADTPHPTTAPPSLVGENPELILALDDDSLVLDVIAALLAPAGYQTVGTTDPGAFIELLVTRAPNMVILNEDMPVVTGIEMCRRLRADTRWVALPVLFLTAHGDADTVARLFEAGADDYTAKPVVGPELVARIRNHLERTRRPRTTAAASALTADVVVVDDDGLLLVLLEQSLATGGYSVTSFSDGPTALQALTAVAGRMPAVRARVIVLDVGLPGMDGLTVLRALARQGITKSARVVMLTARTSEEEVMQALELGAFDHVAKPFSLPVLMQRIRRAFDATSTSH